MSEKRLYAARAATTVEQDTREEIVSCTREVLEELFGRNAIGADDIVSILFTMTDDLHAEFPAAGARALGLTGVPMVCARELEVHDSPLTIERCVRVLVHFYGRARAQPVYLRRAAGLLERVQREEEDAARGE